MRDFQQALNWHTAGKKVAPGTHSVEFTQAILNELNEAIELLRSYQQRDISELDVMGGRYDTNMFLERHTEAPY